MEGEVHWLPVVAVVVGALLLFVAIRVALHLGGRFRWQRLAVECPASGDDVDCVMRVDARSGMIREVEYCSALDNPEDVTCDQDCIAHQLRD